MKEGRGEGIEEESKEWKEKISMNIREKICISLRLIRKISDERRRRRRNRGEGEKEWKEKYI